MGRHSAVGRSGDRIPVMARISAPVQTGPGAHPTSCTTGIGSFPGVKRPEHGADHPPPSKCRGHERVGLYLYSPSWPRWPGIGRTFTFTLHTGHFTGMLILPAKLKKCLVGALVRNGAISVSVSKELRKLLIAKILAIHPESIPAPVQCKSDPHYGPVARE